MNHYYSNPQAVPLVIERFDIRPLLFAFLALCFFLFGIKPAMAQSETNPSWALHSTSGAVSIYYAFSKCDQQDVVLLKFVNAGSGVAEVTWNEKLSLRGKEVYSTSQPKSLAVAAGATAAGACATATVLVVPAYKYASLIRPGVTSFELLGIEVTTLN